MAYVVPALGFATFLLVGDAVQSPVDLELVLATDVSVSMDMAERRAVLQGYADAFRDPAVIASILGGERRRIAVTYVQWAGDEQQITRVSWSLIDSAETSSDFAKAIEHLPVDPEFGPTAIGSALTFSAAMFGDSAYVGDRLVIDISGDGDSNDGLPVEGVRDSLVARGITINGLAMIFSNSLENPDLDRYYRDHVIGGPGSFVSAIHNWSDFGLTLRRKLIREIAGKASPCVQLY